MPPGPNRCTPDCERPDSGQRAADQRGNSGGFERGDGPEPAADPAVGVRGGDLFP